MDHRLVPTAVTVTTDVVPADAIASIIAAAHQRAMLVACWSLRCVMPFFTRTR